MFGTGIFSSATFSLYNASSPLAGLLHNVLSILAITLGIIVLTSFITTLIFRLFMR